MFDGLTIFRRGGTIERAWDGGNDYSEALYNWTKIIIMAARKKNCAYTKDECVAILAEQGITTTVSAIHHLGWKKRLSSLIEKRICSDGHHHAVSLFDPREITRYYKNMKKGRPRRRHNESKS